MAKIENTPLQPPANRSPRPLFSAKTQIPRQGELIVSRRRLLAAVDNYLERGHLWINGPPGAGKTVLAADFAVYASRPVAWYELDQLDTEPVSFFATFPLAFASLLPDFSSAVESLPHLLPENMLTLPVFARKFYRQLFGLLPDRWLLVLDNFQEIPEDSPIIELLVLCLQEIPVSCRVLLLSRSLPSPAFACLKSGGLLQVADRKMLQFRKTEIEEVMALHGMTGEQENCINYLHQATAGWAAGLTLLLKEQNHDNCAHDDVQELDYQELFDYFAGVVFSRFTDLEKNLLLVAALLPEVRPEILDQISGNSSSRNFFIELSRKNFFTSALDHHGEVFLLHPLFKVFLRNRAAEVLAPSALITVQEKSARLLVAEDRVADAVELLNRAGIWPHSIALIQKNGFEMLRQGRYKTLLRWQERLPATMVIANPWLLYFFGHATTAFNPPAAVEMLTRSFHLFREQGNQNGTLLACSALINSIINHLSEIKALDPWLDYMEKQLDPATFSDDNSFEQAAVVNALFRGMVLRRPAHPDLEIWMNHVSSQGGMPLALITYYLWTGRFFEARSVLDRIYAHQDQIESKLQLSAVKAMEVQYYLIMGEVDKCDRVIVDALMMIEETGIRVWEVLLLILGAGCSLNCGEQKNAARYLKAVEEKIDQARLLERSYYHAVKILEALLADDLVAADRHQQSAVDMALDIGMPSYTTWCWYGAALVAVFQGNYRIALSRFEKVLELAALPGNPWFTCQARLGLAYMYLCAGHRQQAVNQLGQGFGLARMHNYLTFFFFVPKMMNGLAVLALEENIELEFTCRFITRWQLTPSHPPVHLENWPWPLKIYTLGRFSVVRFGKSLSPVSLKKNKPIKLLKVLIALGGRQVSKRKIVDVLWSDSNGGEQMAALKITLHRMRQLLGVKNVILQTAKYLTLNPRVCWVDSWQFERVANEQLIAEGAISESRKGDVQKSIALYHGDFLPVCLEEPWSFSYRDRLEKLYRLLNAEGV